MRRFAFIACAIIALCLVPSFAQDADKQDKPDAQRIPWPMGPATQLENVLHLRGVVVVKGYTDIGTITGDYNDSVRVTAVELTTPGTSEKASGLAITVHQGGDPIVESVSYVDFDEIDAMLAALETIAKLEGAAATTMQHYDADYRTRGELELANVDREGVRFLRVQSTVFLPTTQVVVAAALFPANRTGELRRQIEAARNALTKTRAAAK